MHIKDLIPWASKSRPGETKAGDENPIASLQRDMNRAFEQFWNRFETTAGSADWPWGSGGVRSDMVETETGIEISLELPGMDMSDIEVSVSDDTMTVKGEKKVERKDEKKGYYLSERSYGSIYRSLPLPPGVDGDKAEASFKNGVLTVRLPKTPEAQARVKRVTVKAD